MSFMSSAQQNNTGEVGRVIAHKDNSYVKVK